MAMFDKSQKQAKTSLLKLNRELQNLLELAFERMKSRFEKLEELKDSKVFLDSIIQNIPNMIFVKDAKNLKFVRINKAGEKLLGIKAKEMIGKSDADFFSKDQTQFFIEMDKKVLQSREELEIREEPILTKEGIRYLKTKKIPIFSQSGAPQYLLGISEDITKEKEVEFHQMELVRAQAAHDEAQKVSRRLQCLADASRALNRPLGIEALLKDFIRVCVPQVAEICVIDVLDRKRNQVSRTISSLNSHEVKVIQFSIPDFQSKAENLGLGDIFNGADVKICPVGSSSFLKHFLNSAELEGELEELNQGTLASSPLSFGGQSFGALSFVSSQNHPNKFSKDSNFIQDLARQVSFALQNAQFICDANAANQAKSSFLANISHEVRTPLGAILGFAELALEGEGLDEKRRGYISTIIRNGQQLLSLVDEVLDLSKVESEKIKLEILPFSLPRLLEELSHLFQFKMAKKNLKFFYKIDPDSPSYFTGDPHRIRQVLVNLIGNAVKFTNEGVIGVEAKFSPNFNGGGNLTFSITDTGIGISSSQAEKLFEPFAQADQSTTRVFGGTGLGLFLSRKLARLMKGDVVLEESSPQIGSRFRFSVHVSLAKEVPGELQADSSFLNSSMASHCPHAQILVVEDSVDNQVLLKSFLDQNGVTVDVAPNGLEGVKRALAHPYDVVLMDIQMPEMDGFEAIKQLRNEGYKGAVVALTAHAMKGDREKCLLSGFDDYLCKPISRQSLSECLNKNLHH